MSQNGKFVRLPRQHVFHLKFCGGSEAYVIGTSYVAAHSRKSNAWAKLSNRHVEW